MNGTAEHLAVLIQSNIQKGELRDLTAVDDLCQQIIREAAAARNLGKGALSSATRLTAVKKWITNHKKHVPEHFKTFCHIDKETNIQFTTNGIAAAFLKHRIEGLKGGPDDDKGGERRTQSCHRVLSDYEPFNDAAWGTPEKLTDEEIRDANANMKITGAPLFIHTPSGEQFDNGLIALSVKILGGVNINIAHHTERKAVKLSNDYGAVIVMPILVRK